MRRHESPTPRINPSGRKVWCARWTDQAGKKRYGFPPEIKGTYELKRDAQRAIDLCYEREKTAPIRVDTLGGYFATWTQTRPRAKVTDKTNESRIRSVIDVKIEGARLGDWPFDRLRRRHANLLVDHMLRVQGRARNGALNILRTLATMTEDAIEDEVAAANAFRGVKIRANDPRIMKRSRPVRVWSWEQMRDFARACAASTEGGDEIREWRRVYAEPMVRLLSDCGLRAGELLALYRTDINFKDMTLSITRSTNLGEMLDGTKTDHGEVDAGREVPIPAELCGMLKGMTVEAAKSKTYWNTPLLFPSPRGRLWFYTNWWREVWVPGREVAGVDIRPHEMRHSFVSLMRGAGVDPADLADATGHSVETATRKYTHGLGRSFDAMRKAASE